MQIAFKEWAIVVDALGRGEQILILRKGGIAEGRGGFKPEHPEFLLFPTRFHQQRESVLSHAQERFDEIARTFPEADRLEIRWLARVVEWRQIDSLEQVRRFSGQHIWRDEVIAQRFDWGKDKSIFALALRVFRLENVVNLPLLPQYGGCKSWIELDEDISIVECAPVLDDNAFEKKLQLFRKSSELT
jgi:hypothetical protein